MTLAPNTLPMVVRADNIPGPPQGHWTYNDYAAIPNNGERYEIIDKVLYLMPSLNESHQAANIAIASYLFTFVQLGNLGRVYHAPFDVELPTGHTVQPDVMVILNNNSSIITNDNIQGAPDLIVEISSPGTVGYDRTHKQNAYAQSGVREYWIVDPGNQTVEVLVLGQNGYQSVGVFRGQSTLPSQVVPNFPARVEQFFA